VRYWLFQGNPARWRIFDYVRDHGAESFRKTEWSVSRHLDALAPGDGAVLWIAGNARTRGAYGLGRVESAPYRETSGDAYWTDPADRLRPLWFVDLELSTLLFDHPILATDLRRDPRFANASILRMPRGGNPHGLSKEEWRAILDQCPG
jgi:predicted RNA-binding protein with PUA-like domain